MVASSKEKNMKSHNILITGVDFDFQNATMETIEKIAIEIGGFSSYDFDDQKVTHDFMYPIVVPINDLEKIQETFSQLGRAAGNRYGCQYIGNELFLSTRHKGADALSDVGVDVFLR
jgi:hypothetical protein